MLVTLNELKSAEKLIEMGTLNLEGWGDIKVCLYMPGGIKTARNKTEKNNNTSEKPSLSKEDISIKKLIKNKEPSWIFSDKKPPKECLEED